MLDAARLAALGCTPAQIARHLASVAALARKRVAHEQIRPRKKPDLILSEAQVVRVLAALRERPYRWARGVANADGTYRQCDDWAGHAVARVLNASLQAATEVLAGLRDAGRIKVVCVEGSRALAVFVPAVRVRLDDAERATEPRERGQHGDIGARLGSSTSASSRQSARNVSGFP
jgi:hypothetical protein